MRLRVLLSNDAVEQLADDVLVLRGRKFTGKNSCLDCEAVQGSEYQESSSPRTDADRDSGAVVGDFLDKPLDHGGLNLSRFAASAILVFLIVAFIYIFPQKAAERGH